MAIQFPRGNISANDVYTGPTGSLSVDFEGEVLRVHDGTTAGGAFSVGISGEGDGNTDLSVNYATDSFTITSSTGTNAQVDAATTSQAGAMSAADKTKLDGIEEEATANEEDSFLLDRSNHTGTQAASTITNFEDEVVSAVENNDIDFGEL